MTVSHPAQWLVRFACTAAVIVGAATWLPGPPCASAQAADTLSASSTQIATPNQGEPQAFSVSRSVTNGMTGEPIRKALVQLNAQPRRTTFSDADGHFQFDAVRAGPVAFSAQKPGYFSEQELTHSGVVPVDVGSNGAPVAVKLFPEAVIFGKVTTAAGLPLEHVPVTLTRLDIREGQRHWDNHGTTNTDGDGGFRFSDLRPGAYYVATAPYRPVAESMLEADEPAVSGYSGVYYPGTFDLASATPLEVHAGQQTEADFSLQDVPAYRVSGTITGYVPDQGVALQIFDPSGVAVPIGVEFSSENGRFDVRALPAGEYTLKASLQTGPNQTMRGEARLSVHSNLYNLHLAMAPSLTIPIVVTMESRTGTDPMRRPRIGPYSSGPPVSVRLTGSGPGTTDAFAVLEGPPNEKNLVFHNVDPGRYSAVIDARESWYVSSAEYGQTNLLADDLVVMPGASPVPLTVRLRNDGASLSGTVHLPDGFTNRALVLAIPEGLAKASPRISYCYPPRDKSGSPPEFLLDSVAPGDYIVFAFDRTDGIEFSNSDVIQKYLSRSQRVTLSSNQRAKVALELIRTGDDTH